MLGNNSETNEWILCLWMLKGRLSHALLVYEILARYLDEQIIYGWKEEDKIIQIVSRFGMKSLSKVMYAWQ